VIGCAVAMLLAGTGAPHAETLSGTVSSGGTAIVGATVRLLELDRVQHTGAGGRFTFTAVPKGTFHVFASVIGHASATNVVEVANGEAQTRFDLKVSAIPMQEIVVSASPYPRIEDELYQSVASKAQVEFVTSTGMSYAEKLADVPGVNVRGNGSAPNRPVLRGMSDNRVLVLENGLRNGDISTYDPAHATPIEAMSISQIDVVRGPASILYGPSTIGGLVNAITNMVPGVLDRPVSGTVAVEGNSVADEYTGYFNSVFSGRNQALRVSAGGLHSQDIRIPSTTTTDPGTGRAFELDRIPQSFDRSSEEGLGYTYQGGFGSIGVGGKHFEMNYGIPGVPPNPDFDASTSRIEQKRSTLELHGLFTRAGSLLKQWRLDSNYNDYNHSEFPTAQDPVTGEVSEPQANHFHKRSFNGVLQFQHQPVGKLHGVVGLWSNIEDMTIDGDQPLGPNSLTTGYAAYAFEEFAATQNTNLQAGLRFDYNKIQTNPSPTSTDSVFQTLDTSRLTNAATASIGLIQRFSSELTGSVSFARSFRAPTVQELFANGLDAPSGTYSIGNADLGPETGFGVDASIKGRFPGLVFEVSPYVNIVNDYIYAFLRGDTIQAFPVREFAATDARLLGFEASITVQPRPHIALLASSDYVRAENTRQDVPLPFTPPLRGLLRATYQDGRNMGMVEWRGAADQDRLGDGDTPTKGWGIVNLGAGVRIASGSIAHNVSVHCDNLFDRAYQDHLSVIKDFVPQPGRGFRLNYEMQF
jgi:iron complex outermembrane receptor protein